MAFIVQRLTDNRLELGREELIRPMPWGNQWQAVRIAALVQVNTGSAFNSPYSFPQIALGLSTGNSGILVDNTVDVIGGAPSTNFATAGWTYTQGAGPSYYTTAPTTGMTGFQKLGSAFTTATNGSTAASIGALSQAGNNTVNRVPIVVDIVKNTYTSGLSSPYTITLWTPSTAANLVDCTPALFFTGIQILSAPTGATAALSSIGAASLAVSGNMQHNSAWLMWNRCQPTLYISEFAVIRFS